MRKYITLKLDLMMLMRGYYIIFSLVNVYVFFVMLVVRVALLKHYHQILEDAPLPLPTIIALDIWWWPCILVFVGVIGLVSSFTQQEIFNRKFYYVTVVLLLVEVTFLVTLPWLYYYPYMFMSWFTV